MKIEYVQIIKEKKKCDPSYLFELQKFLDTVENIQDTEFKNRIIGQMLKCEEALTKLMEKIYNEV